MALPLKGGFHQYSYLSIVVLAATERKTAMGREREAGGVMTKKKPGKFSVTKAVKSNARDRVGQPKPARVLDTEPKTGRDEKHKPKLEEIIRSEE